MCRHCRSLLTILELASYVRLAVSDGLFLSAKIEFCYSNSPIKVSYMDSSGNIYNRSIGHPRRQISAKEAKAARSN
jgi:hypothetical protein